MRKRECKRVAPPTQIQIAPLKGLTFLLGRKKVWSQLKKKIVIKDRNKRKGRDRDESDLLLVYLV